MPRAPLFLVVRALLMIGLLLPVHVGLAEELPSRAYIEGVRGRAQRFSLSCESRSAVDLAAFWGVSIGEKKFLNALPRSKNPDTGFVGNPNDPWGNIPPRSYGVHAEPVAATLSQFGLHAEARLQMGWDELRSEIAAGRPVIVWVIGQMWPGTALRYVAPDGSATTVAHFEHTMIVIGYDPKNVYVVDAYTGQSQIYPVSVFKASWRTLGRMAVISQGSGVSTAADNAEEPANSYAFFVPAVLSGRLPGVKTNLITGHFYTVQWGDRLVDIAREHQIDLRKLAWANRLAYPFSLRPGQTIKIPPR